MGRLPQKTHTRTWEAVVASHATTINTPMRPIISDIIGGAPNVVVNWIRLTPYAASSVFTSRVFDALVPVNWTSASWNADLPAGTSLVVSVRRGTTPTPDGTWTAWTPVATSGAAIGGTSRYIQYQVTLSTTDPAQSPALRDLTLVRNDERRQIVADALARSNALPILSSNDGTVVLCSLALYH